MKKTLAAIAAVLLTLAAAPRLRADAVRVSRGRGGAVAAAEKNAAGVGIEILAKGGNAADAAVAVAFALAVTWPAAGNIGGGGFWISTGAAGKTLAIDFREVAPRTAGHDLFLRGEKGAPPPSSTEGALASGVPGTVAGLALAHRRAGRLPWKVVVEPAVRLARDGFVMTQAVSDSIAGERKRLAADAEAARIFLPGGAPPPPGVVFRQPDLARTLEAIRDLGEDGFYRGGVARAIEQGQKKSGGLISRGDLGRYQAKERKPLRFRFAGADVLTLPAPSSGPVLAEMALLVEIVGRDRFLGSGAAASHWLAEIEKRAFYDRNHFLGDPDFGGVRQGLFTDPAHLKILAASIDPHRATPSDELGRIETEKPNTTHFSVVDGQGMAVAVTTTLNDLFGNARVAPGLGFLMNNEMDDFATRPGEKNLYGLVQGELNSVGPGKRMLSSMCPSIALEGGRVVLVWGTPGGSTIPTTNLQILIHSLLQSEPLEASVAAPRFHQQDLPDAIQIERGRFDEGWIAALRAMGHTVTERGPIGSVHAIAIGSDGVMTAVADPRGEGAGLVLHPVS